MVGTKFLSGQTTIDGKRGMQLLSAIEQRIQSMFVMFDGYSLFACRLGSVMTQDGCPRTNGMTGSFSEDWFSCKRPVFVRSGDYKVSCAYMLFCLTSLSRSTCYTGSHRWNFTCNM